MNIIAFLRKAKVVCFAFSINSYNFSYVLISTACLDYFLSRDGS